MKKEDIVEAFDNIKKQCLAALDREEELSKRLLEFNKDDEIAKMREEILDLRRRSFTLSDKDIKTIDEFKTTHWNRCGKMSSFAIIFHPTHIETFVEVQCSKCGEKIDVN